MKKEKNLVEFLFLVLNFDAEVALVCLKSLVGGVSVCMFSWIRYFVSLAILFKYVLRFLVLNGYYEWGFFDIKLSEFS